MGYRSRSCLNPSANLALTSTKTALSVRPSSQGATSETVHAAAKLALTACASWRTLASETVTREGGALRCCSSKRRSCTRGARLRTRLHSSNARLVTSSTAYGQALPPEDRHAATVDGGWECEGCFVYERRTPGGDLPYRSLRATIACLASAAETGPALDSSLMRATDSASAPFVAAAIGGGGEQASRATRRLLQGGEEPVQLLWPSALARRRHEDPPEVCARLPEPHGGEALGGAGLAGGLGAGGGGGGGGRVKP